MFSYRCLGCGEKTYRACVRCADYLTTLVAPSCEHATVAFEFAGVVRDLVVGFKYRNHRAVGHLLSAFLVRNIKELVADVRPEVITWIPTTRKRKINRGHDQAETIARYVGKQLCVPVRPLLERITQEHQTGRGRSDRLVGVQFRPRGIGRYSRILVIDDVVTTGATLRMARRALMSAGATEIACAALAATPAHGLRR